MGQPSAKKIEWLEVEGQLFAQINRRPSLAKITDKPKSREIASTNEVTVPTKKPNKKKRIAIARNDKEKGSVSHFPGGYHIGILKSNQILCVLNRIY